jgi:hypothetical protein
MPVNVRESIRQSAILGTAATVLLIFFVFMAGPVLKALYNLVGSRFYVFSAVFFVAPFFVMNLFPIGVFSLGVWVTIGTYSWLEENGRVSFWWATAAVAAGILVSVLVPAIYVLAFNVDVSAIMSETVSQVSKLWSSQSATPLTEEQTKALGDLSIRLMPGFIGVLLMGTLAVGLLYVEKFSQLFGLKYERIAGEMKLMEFRVPDFVIWITIAALLLSIFKLGDLDIQALAMNVLILVSGAYFFQGLAVIEYAFEYYQVNQFVRLLIYVFVIAQLFFLLSLVGLADFWIDVRKRLKVQKALSQRKEE